MVKFDMVKVESRDRCDGFVGLEERWGCFDMVLAHVVIERWSYL